MGSWSTALVGRPPTPPLPGPPAPAPFMPSACPAAAAPATPPAVPPPGVIFAPPPFVHFTNQTLRQIVRTSVGGSRLRVVLSDAFGSAPLTIGAAHIALRESDEVIRAGQGRPLTFSGRSSVTIPANAIVYSDAVALTVPPMSDLAVDVYLPGTTNTPAPLSRCTTRRSRRPTSLKPAITRARRSCRPLPPRADWFLLSRVEVDAPDVAGVVVAFGDSITDGAASTADTNSRWPNILARRLLGSATPMKVGVLNAGIGGNRVVSEGAYGSGINALARFEVDALSHPGVTHIIVMEGINDIGNARQESDANRPGPHRRSLAANRAGSRQGSEDSRRDADALLGSRLLH